MSRKIGGALGGLLLVVALGMPATALAGDDTGELAKKLDEKCQKAFQKAEKAQRKAADKAARREAEAREKLSEEQREAREKAEKAQRKAALSEDGLLKHPDKYEEEALDELDDRIDDYVDKVHEKALEQVGELPKEATPGQLQAHERALGEAIRARRPQARQGDLFVPEVQPILKRIIAGEMDGQAGAPARKEALNGNPLLDPDRDDRVRVTLSVNAVYPEAAPLSNVPPSILLSLPLLKREVEYRFVGRDLVLRDREANLILDYLPQAAPPLTATAAAKPAPAPKR